MQETSRLVPLFYGLSSPMFYLFMLDFLNFNELTYIGENGRHIVLQFRGVDLDVLLCWRSYNKFKLSENSLAAMSHYM